MLLRSLLLLLLGTAAAFAQPTAVPDCTADENLERPGGRGLALIQAYMTHVEYNKCGNSVTMEKTRTAS